MDSRRRLARTSFVSGGWSTGVIARVAAWAARVHPGAVVATVFPDGPHRYLSAPSTTTTFCRGPRPRPPPRAATRPVQLPAPRRRRGHFGWACCTRASPTRGRPYPHLERTP
ncbi:hypothetical protein LT493_10070 [Streptomyces tricolor]|nr:hypothetical protein [Streptomyces tricolor]